MFITLGQVGLGSSEYREAPQGLAKEKNNMFLIVFQNNGERGG